MERKGTGKLRVINDQKVFDYFINEEIGTKKEISQKTNVSIMTTGTILNDFLSKGIIVENELIYVEKGRPTHQWSQSRNRRDKSHSPCRHYTYRVP